MTHSNSNKDKEIDKQESPSAKYVKRVNDQVLANREKYISRNNQQIDDLIKERVELLVQKRLDEIVEQKVIAAIKKHTNH